MPWLQAELRSLPADLERPHWRVGGIASRNGRLLFRGEAAQTGALPRLKQLAGSRCSSPKAPNCQPGKSRLWSCSGRKGAPASRA